MGAVIRGHWEALQGNGRITNSEKFVAIELMASGEISGAFGTRPSPSPTRESSTLQAVAESLKHEDSRGQGETEVKGLRELRTEVDQLRLELRSALKEFRGFAGGPRPEHAQDLYTL